MEKDMKKSTLWLDILVYILLPLVAVIGWIRVARTLFGGGLDGRTIVVTVLLFLYATLCAVSSYYAHKRARCGFVLLRVLIVVTAVVAGAEFAWLQNHNNDVNIILAFLGYFVICSAVWILPHEIYFKARKDLFKNECNCSCKWFKKNSET